METFSALLAICAGNSPVTAEFHSQRPVTWSFEVFFDLRLGRLSEPSWGWWFETLSCLSWRHCYVLRTTRPFKPQSIASTVLIDNLVPYACVSYSYLAGTSTVHTDLTLRGQTSLPLIILGIHNVFVLTLIICLYFKGSAWLDSLHIEDWTQRSTFYRRL